jgi:hypothetical protein
VELTTGPQGTEEGIAGFSPMALLDAVLWEEQPRSEKQKPERK